MKDHEYYMELASRSVDETLGDVEKDELAEHLSVCSECREFLEFCRAIEGNLPIEDAPEELIGNVLSEVQKQKTAKRKRSGLRFWLPRGGALIAASIALVLVARSGLFGSIGSSSDTGGETLRNAESALFECNAFDTLDGSAPLENASIAEQPNTSIVTSDKADGESDAAKPQINAVASAGGSTAFSSIEGTLAVSDDGMVELILSEEQLVLVEQNVGSTVEQVVVVLDSVPEVGEYPGIYSVLDSSYDIETMTLTVYLSF